jgi:hypothetical protein
MLQEALDAKGFSGHMYFSTGNWLLAQSVQQAVSKGYGIPGVAGSSAAAPGSKNSARAGGGGGSSSTLWGRSDSRFVWNQELLRPLLGESMSKEGGRHSLDGMLLDQQNLTNTQLACCH